MILSPTPSPTAVVFAQDIAQPHADRFVYGRERGLMAVLEIFIPAHQSPIDVALSSKIPLKDLYQHIQQRGLQGGVEPSGYRSDPESHHSS